VSLLNARRDLLAFGFLAAGLVCVVFAVDLAPQGCENEATATVAGVLGVFSGPLLFAASTFVLAATRATTRWVPWVTASVTLVIAVFTLSLWTYVTLIDTCTA
jgi:hypothetical protein